MYNCIKVILLYVSQWVSRCTGGHGQRWQTCAQRPRSQTVREFVRHTARKKKFANAQRRSAAKPTRQSGMYRPHVIHTTHRVGHPSGRALPPAISWRFRFKRAQCADGGAVHGLVLIELNPRVSTAVREKSKRRACAVSRVSRGCRGAAGSARGRQPMGGRHSGADSQSRSDHFSVIIQRIRFNASWGKIQV